MNTLRKLFGRSSASRPRSKQSNRDLRRAPRLEPLEDRQLLSVSSLLEPMPVEGRVSHANEPAQLSMSIEADAPVWVSMVIQGKDAGFDPGRISFYQDNAARTPYSGDPPGSMAPYAHWNFDGKSSVHILQLAPGDYSIDVYGENGTMGAFIADVYMPGDVNGSHSISDYEYYKAWGALLQEGGSWNANTASLLQKYGVSMSVDQFHEGMDADRNGMLTSNEFTMISNNMLAGHVTVDLVADQDPPAIDVAPGDVEITWNTVDGTLYASDPELTIDVSDESDIVSFSIGHDGTYIDYFGQIGADGGAISLSEADLIALGLPNDGSHVDDGEHTLQFIAMDEHGNAYTTSAPFTFTYTLLAGNVAPVAGADTLSAHEDGPAVSVNVLANDSDANTPDGDVIRVDAFTDSQAWGDVELDANGLLTFTPNESFFRFLAEGESYTPAIEVSYTIRDGLEQTSTAVVTINVTGDNDAPTAFDDAAAATEGQAEVIAASALLANDQDPDLADILAIDSNDAASALGAVVSFDGTNFTYDPTGVAAIEALAVGETTTDTFTYTMTDGHGATSTATVTITVTGVNDDPIAVDDTAAATEGQPLDIADSALLANDTDVDTNDTLSIYHDGSDYVFDTTSTLGAAISYNDGTGQFTYDPTGVAAIEALAAGETTTDTFTYTMTDGHGVTSTATVTITVTGVNDAPIATVGTLTDSTTEDPEDGYIVLDSAAIIANFTDVDSDATAVTIESITLRNASQGKVVFESSEWRYYPNEAIPADPNGAGELDYLQEGETLQVLMDITVEDNHGAQATAELDVTVTGMNDLVSVPDQGFSIPNIGDNDLANGAELTVGFVDTNDLDAGDTYTFVLDSATANPDDIGLDPSIFQLDPNTGRIYITADGTGEQLPDLEENYSFELKITPSDSQAGVQGTVTITVTPNLPPVVNDITGETVDEESSLSYSAAQLYAQLDPVQPDADPTELAFTPGTGVSTDLGVSYTIAADGAITYNAQGLFDDLAVGESVTDRVPFQIKDDAGNVTTAYIHITITGVNDAPTPVSMDPLTDTALEGDDDGSYIVLDTAAIQAHFTDVDSDAAPTEPSNPVDIVSIVLANDSQGKVAFESNEWRYYPNENGELDYLTAGQTLDVAMTITVSDDHGAQATAGLVVTVTGENDAPIAVNDSATTNKVMEGTFNVLTNDQDKDAGEKATLTVTSFDDISSPETGTLVYDGAGQFRFTPGTDYVNLGQGQSATVTFDYTIEDAQGATDTATVTITIQGGNVAPTANDFTVQVNASGTVLVDLDQPGRVVDDAAGWYLASLSSVGDVAATGVGMGVTTITFDPNDATFLALTDSQSATRTFTYTIMDADGELSGTGTITLEILGEDDAPRFISTALENDFNNEFGSLVLPVRNVDSNLWELTPPAYTHTDLDHFMYDPEGEAVAYVVTISDPTQAILVDAGGAELAHGDTVDGRVYILDTDGPLFIKGLANADAAPTISFIASDFGANEFAAGTFTMSLGSNLGPAYSDETAFENQIESIALPVRPTNTIIGGYSTDLDAYFTDPEGHDLTYTVTISNPDLVVLNGVAGTPQGGGMVYQLDANDTFVLESIAYSYDQDWTPADISITATDEMGNDFVVDTFSLSPELESSAEFFLVVRDDLSANATSASKPTSDSTVTDQYYIEVWFKDNLSSTEFAYDELAIFSGGTDLTWTGASSVSAASVSKPVDWDFLVNPGSKIITGTPPATQVLGIDGTGFGQGDTLVNGRDNYVLAYYARLTPSSATGAGAAQSIWAETPDGLSVPVTRSIGNDFFEIHESQLHTSAAGFEISEPIEVTVNLTTSSLHSQPIDGTNLLPGVYVSVNKEASPVDETGRNAGLPGSVAWIDEWDTHYAELWVNASELDAITGASATLTYNADFFTATNVELGAGIADALDITIDDETGTVSITGAKALGEGLGGEGLLLLGRVQFESIGDDNVLLAEHTNGVDLGLSVTSASFEKAGGEMVDVHTGAAPTTDLFAVPYDTDENGAVNFMDFLRFTSAYGDQVSSNALASQAAADYNRSGGVGFDDFLYFSSNYGKSRGGDAAITYPRTFEKGWIGSHIDVTGDATLEQLLAAANDEWAQMLGLESPIDVNLYVEDLPGAQIGSAEILSLDENGVPTEATIIIDVDAAGHGWYASTDGQVPGENYDLYSTVLHELGHAYGFTSNFEAFASLIEQTVDGPIVPLSNVNVALDSDGEHLSDARHASDVMSPELPAGVTEGISMLDVLILKEAYAAAATGDFGLSGGASALFAAPAIVEAAPVETFAASVDTFEAPSRDMVDVFAPISGDEDSTSENGELSDALRDQLYSQGIAVTIPAEEAERRAEEQREAVWSDWSDEDDAELLGSEEALATIDALMADLGEDVDDLGLAG